MCIQSINRVFTLTEGESKSHDTERIVTIAETASIVLTENILLGFYLSASLIQRN